MCLDNFGGKKPWSDNSPCKDRNMVILHFHDKPTTSVWGRSGSDWQKGACWRHAGLVGWQQLLGICGFGAGPAAPQGVALGCLGSGIRHLCEMYREGLWKTNLLRLGCQSLHRKKKILMVFWRIWGSFSLLCPLCMRAGKAELMWWKSRLYYYYFLQCFHHSRSQAKRMCLSLP